MTHRLPLATALAALLSLGCMCGDVFDGVREGFDEGFCKSYPQSFLDGCRKTCEGSKTAEECENGCNASLQTDQLYKRCLAK
jgi:hypothetical protein